MKHFIFIVTNNENHWSDMTKGLKEKEINFYPETQKEFHKLRCLFHNAFSAREEIAIEAENEIKEVINKLPKEIFCLIRFQITEEDWFSDNILFSQFYEKFLMNRLRVKMIIYYDYGYECSCDDCAATEKKQRQKAIDYCFKNKFPTFCWGGGENLHFFTKDWRDFQRHPREELMLSDILKQVK